VREKKKRKGFMKESVSGKGKKVKKNEREKKKEKCV
jgi:hypothetical protein